jgi:hypothetical protein
VNRNRASYYPSQCNGAKATGVVSPRICRRWCRLVTALALFGCCVYAHAPAVAQVTERLPDQDNTATSIVDIDGRTWVATPDGAYRIDGDTAKRVPDFKVDVTGVFDAGGHVWLATTQGAYRIDDGDRAVRVPDRGLVVTSVTEIAGRVWIAATNGAYLVNGDDARRVPDGDLDVAAIVPIDGIPWLATDQGAFRLIPSGNSFTAAHMVDMAYDLNQILEIDGTPWLATDQGAFRGSTPLPQPLSPPGKGQRDSTPHPNPLLGKEREPEESEPTPNPSLKGRESDFGQAATIAWQHIELITPADPSHRFTGKQAEIFHIIPAGGQIWFIGAAGPFRVDGDVAHRMPDAKLLVATVADAGGHVWIASRTGAYRVDGDSLRRIPDLPLDVTGVSEAAGHVWLATSSGAYEVDGDSATRIPDENVSVSGVSDIGGRTFVTTANGAYLVDHGHAYPMLDSDVAVLSVYNAGGDAWMATSQGAFRVDPSRVIEVRLVPITAGWRSALRRLLPRGFLLAGAYGLRVVYEQAEAEPTPNPSLTGGESGEETSAADARVVVNTDAAAYQRSLDQGHFAEPSSIMLTLSPGAVTIHVAVKDGWLPVVERPISVRVVPAWSVVLVLLAVVWLAFIFAVFLLSPISIPCHRLLMHPGFRTIGSLWTISLALTALPAVGWYLLIRYRRQLPVALGRDDDKVKDVNTDALSERLLVNRVAAVAPAADTEPFITACHIARLALSRAGGFRRLRSTIAAPLLAAGDEARDLDGLAVDLLAQYGDITDRALGRWLIGHGSFLFIVEADSPDAMTAGEAATALQAFVERHRRRSYVCLVGGEQTKVVNEPLLRPFG